MGTISVDLVANTVSFSDSMSRMSQLSLTTGKNVQRSLGLITTAATGMAAAVIASLSAVIVKSEDFAFAMSKAAEATGTTTEMFSKLAYSAKIAGVPVDLVRTAMERLGKTAGAAQSGQKESISAYAALGISVKDLSGPLKDSGSLLVAVSKSLEKFGDSTNKVALEQHLLGRSGAELAPLLRQLSTGFDTASQQATLFGVVVGDKTAAQAKKLHTSMVGLESVALGLSLRLLSGVSPALEDASGKILNFVTSANGMKTVDRIADDVAAAVHGVGNAFQFLTDHSTAAKRTLEGLAALQVGTILLPLVGGAAKAGIGLDSIGLSAVKMVGRLSGVSAALPILATLGKEIQLQTFMIRTLAAEESVWTGVTYGAATAWKTLTAAMVNNPGVVALALLAGGLSAFKSAMDSDIAASGKFGDAATSWGDEWKAAIDNTVDSLRAMQKMMTGFGIHDGWEDYKKIPTFGERTHQIANDRAHVSRFTQAPDLNPAASLPKLDAPPLPKEGVERIDIVKKKLLELRDAAEASQQALKDAGKGVDFQRADEAAKESKKTIDELNLALAVKHKRLTTAQEDEIRADTATRINNLSQASYRDSLAKTTENLTAQAYAQSILTAAIARGANAVKAAAIAANAVKRDAGQSPEWLKSNAAARAKDDAAFAGNYDKSNAESDATALAGVQAQINAQLRLNAAILRGKDARSDAALEIEQQSIRERFDSKGDTNKSALAEELAANEKLYRQKQAEQDLNRAASMNPAQAYRDELTAIQSASDAAKEHGIALDYRAILAANKTALMGYTAQLREMKLATGSATDGMQQFFSDFVNGGKSAAQQVYDFMTQTFESLNTQLVKLMDGQKTNWKSFFEGVAESLQKTALQKAESGIVQLLPKSITGDLGIGKMGTQSNPMYVKIAGGGMSLPSSGSGGLGSLADLTQGDTSNQAGGGGGFLSSLFSGGVDTAEFAGGMATGGDVMAGMTYDVGEMGREKFTPTQNGKITPNSKLDKGGLTIGHIDARGANDPAQTEAAIHRAMSVYGPAIASGAIRAQSEKQFRSPLSKH